MEKPIIGLYDNEPHKYAMTFSIMRRLMILDTYPTLEALEKVYKNTLNNVRIDENEKNILCPVEITRKRKGKILMDLIVKYNKNVN